MLVDRIEFGLSLVVTTSLMVGSGRADKQADGEIQDVQRGRDGAPCLNAATIKGALRAAWHGASADMFGEIVDGRDGTAGRLRLSAAQLQKPGRGADNVPVGDGSGIYVKAANAIDRRRGAVEGNRFFRRYTVAPGAVFALQGRYLFDATVETPDQVLERLASVLAVLRDGIRIGKNTRHNGGGVALGEVRAARARIYNPDLGFEFTDLREKLAKAVGSAIRPQGAPPVCRASLLLRASTPFLIQDHDPQPGANTESVAALRDSSGGPVLWASSVLGVLRARAAWLAELDRLRRSSRGEPPRFIPSERDEKSPADDLQLACVLDGERAVRSLSDVARLSSVERLFGVPGWRGLIEIARLDRTEEGRTIELSNVAIDRFSGGALDTALFRTGASVGCSFRVELVVRDGAQRLASELTQTSARERRRDAERVIELLQSDRELFDELIADVTKKGLMLGHAAARGLGWFDVTGDRA